MMERQGWENVSSRSSRASSLRRSLWTQPLGDDTASPVFVKSTVRADGQPSSPISPVATHGGFTLAACRDADGRKHQIRAHAQWLGHNLVGDKIYGPDARLYLDHRPRMDRALAAKLLLSRQAALAEIDLRPAGLEYVFTATLRRFACVCREAGLPLNNTVPLRRFCD